MPDSDARTLAEIERDDPFAPHDPGCQCWPHVSQRAAIEASVQAAILERRVALAAALPAPLDVERLARALAALEERNELSIVDAYLHDEAAAIIAREYAAATEPAAKAAVAPFRDIMPRRYRYRDGR